MIKYFTLPLVSFLLFLVTGSSAQQFDWAMSYNITNSNEVAALTVDESNNAYIAGVHEASQSLPYTGNCYLLKANSGGAALWTRFFSGQVQIGDVVYSGGALWIVGQSNGLFTYDGASYGIPAYHMFMMKTDTAGSLLWIATDATRNGAGANLVSGEAGQVAVNLKGVSNIGNFIQLLDADGSVLKSKEITGHSTNITDIAFYNDRVYLNGAFNGSDSLVVDDVVIHAPAIEHAAFVLALDSNFIAEWASVDTTINNRDGRIEAGDAGVYACFSVLEPPFNIVNVVKRFSAEGQMIREAEIPFFTTAVTLYPDMVLAPGMLGFYASNDFGNDIHEVILFDESLNLIDELSVAGLSDLYSGQISTSSDGFMIAHVHSGDLNFNDEFTLTYTGSGKRPYIGRLSVSEPTGLAVQLPTDAGFLVYPNPSNRSIYVELPDFLTESLEFRISDVSGRMIRSFEVHSGVNELNISNIPSGVYVGSVYLPNHTVSVKKLIIR